jgi:hypothetical protein
MNSKKIKIIVILLGIIGLILIAWGVTYKVEIYSNILIAFGSGILGAGISTIFSLLGNTEIIDALNPTLKNDIISEENNVKDFRQKFHFYWVTKIENRQTWYHAIINFKEYNILGRLKGDYFIFTKSKNLLKYHVVGGVRGKILVLSIQPINSKEPEIIAIFPDFGLKFRDNISGYVFHETYDGKEIIAPAIISSQNIGKFKSIGFVPDETENLLIDIWKGSNVKVENIDA